METNPTKTKEKTSIDNKKIDMNTIEFGKITTDHMYIATFEDGNWEKGKIVPYKNLSLSPFTSGLHYGQTVFEGMKAFRSTSGGINIFRPQKHAERFNRSLRRMCMPEVPEIMFLQALTDLITIDSDWVPTERDASLYIRPFMFASDTKLGVHIANNYTFIIVCSPAGKYYSNPLRVKIETHYTRAFDGGTGEAKCGGNYGGAFYPFSMAKAEGFDQIIWTDAKTHEFVEESGTMNLGFIIDKTFITPPLNNTILEGITRDSIIKIAPHVGLNVEERPVNYHEIFNWANAGKRKEAFGIGTAALIAPIKEIVAGQNSCITYFGEDSEMFKLKNYLCNIRQGLVEDIYNWNFKI